MPSDRPEEKTLPGDGPPVAQSQGHRVQRRRVVKVLLGVILGLAILGIWLYWIGFQDILASLKTVAPAPALVAVLAWILSMGLRSWKWHILLLSTQKVPFSISGRIYWVSAFLNVLFPFRVGELTRSLFLKQLVDLPVSVSLPTVLVDRLYSIAVILLGLLFLPLAPFQLQTSTGPTKLGMHTLRWGVGIVAAIFLACLVFLYLVRNQKTRMLSLARRALFILPDRWTNQILSFVDTMIDSMRLVQPAGPGRLGGGQQASSKRWAAARSALYLLAWSLAVLVVDAIKDHSVLRAFGLDVSITTCFLGVCLTNLAFILPSPPGNIGSSEWYATLVYSSGFGYDPSRVAGGALFGHAMTALVVAVGGALSLSGLGINLAESLRISQNRSPTEPDSEQETRS